MKTNYLKNITKWFWSLVRNPIFLLFLFLSFALWYMNKLNYTYVSDIDINLIISGNFDNGLTVSDPIPVNARVRGTGYNLLPFKIFGQKKDIPVEGRMLTLERRDSIYYISLISIESAIYDNLPGLEFIALNNRDIKVDLIKIYERTVPVISNIHIDPYGEYMQIGEIIFTPDSVTVRGDTRILDTLTGAYTEAKVIRNKETRNGIIPLVKINGMDYSVSKVGYNVDIAEFTEITKDVPVVLLNANANRRYVVIPENVRLKFNVASRFYRESKHLTVNPYVDMSARNPSAGDIAGENKYRVRIDSLPYWIKLVKTEPLYVTILRDRSGQ